MPYKSAIEAKLSRDVQLAGVAPYWQLFSWLIALLLLLPLIQQFATIFMSDGAVKLNHLLALYFVADFDAFITLSVIVPLSCLLLAVPLGYMFACYDFPLKRLLYKLMFLPLAIPGYLLASSYQPLIEPAFKAHLALPVGVLVLGLFPVAFWIIQRTIKYFYLANWHSLKLANIDSGWRLFLYALRFSRGAIGFSFLAVFIALNAEFTLFYFLQINTPVTVLYQLWVKSESFVAVALIGLIPVMLIVVCYLFQVGLNRNRLSNHTVQGKHPPPQFNAINRLGFTLLLMVSLLLTGIGFLYPVIYWLQQFPANVAESVQAQLLPFSNSLWLSLIAAVLVIFIALWQSYGRRLNRKVGLPLKLASWGERFPALLIGLFSLSLMSAFKFFLVKYQLPIFDQSLVGYFIPAVVVFGWVCCFSAIGNRQLSSELNSSSLAIEKVAHTKGWSYLRVLLGVHIRSRFTSFILLFILLFIECFTEFSIVWLMQPQGLELISAEVFKLVLASQNNDAAPAVMLMALLGVIKVLIISRDRHVLTN